MSNHVYMLSCSYSRPDAQPFEGQEEELNRELPDEILRRQLINNLAKHVLFSKTLTTLKQHRANLVHKVFSDHSNP